MKALYSKYILNFKEPGGTSRGILRSKETYFLKILDKDRIGIGECALFRGLSVDDRSDYEEKLQWLCNNIHLDLTFLLSELLEFPSIQFGMEQALLSLKSKDPFVIYPSKFTQGHGNIVINGLIWMGSTSFMQKQIEKKIKAGFKTLKLKIGAIDFKSEVEMIKSIRKDFSVNEIELRVDANGAFQPGDALEKLKRLSDFELHSIEQPIKTDQWYEMADLCTNSPLPIALDEELIGVFKTMDKEKMLQIIRPQYIILKPSLIGGFKASDEWINIAKNHNVAWWITSALESNIGLNAIAQYTYTLQTSIPQGLGTGSLFTNNIESPLKVDRGALFYSKKQKWGDMDAFLI